MVDGITLDYSRQSVIRKKLLADKRVFQQSITRDHSSCVVRAFPPYRFLCPAMLFFSYYYTR